MRKTPLQTGQCVFCEICHTGSSIFGRPLRQRGQVDHVRRITSAREKHDAADNGATRSWLKSQSSSKAPNRSEKVDLRSKIRDPNTANAAWRRGFLRISSFNEDGRQDESLENLTFHKAVLSRLDSVQHSIKDWDALQVLGLNAEEEKASFADYRDHVIKAVTSSRLRQRLKTHDKEAAGEGAKLAQDLERAFESRGAEELDATLKYGYYGHVAASKFSTQHVRTQKNLADLRYPLEWFPRTRAIRRTIHLHVGPTNSGKTYRALKALEAAPKGLYAGPLRLLAHEVYTRLNASGRRCQLVTGEERRFPDDDPTADMISCTVEMVDCGAEMDVAVIDEIQMIGSEERGWAWTQALLGVQAKEVHLCGEERSVPLIKALAAMMGDPLEVHRYERLSPLEMDHHHLNGNLNALRKGDCIVAFSVLGIHALKRSIERTTKKKVAIVYGSLPPETRAQQAKLFNEPDNDYDFLVASDAVGMGLNLSIKRVIFESSQKNDGVSMRTLKVAEVKQIAGRAGRYRTAHQAVKDATSTLDAAPPDVQPSVEVVEPNNDAELHAEGGQSTSTQNHSSTEALLSSDFIEGEESKPAFPLRLSMRGSNRQEYPEKRNVGLVTTLYPFDFPIIDRAMKLQPEPIKSAGLQPPGTIVERFTSYFPPGTPFSYILLRLNEISQMSTRFHLCGLRSTLLVADAIHPVEGLTTADRIIICAAPVSLKRDPEMKTFLQSLARAIANKEGGSLLDFSENELPLGRLDDPVDGGRQYLQDMEQLHKMIILYLWLSYRFSGVFNTRQLAFYVKELIEKRIDAALSKFNFTEASRRKIMEAREKNLMQEMEKEAFRGLSGDGVRSEEGYGEVRTNDETAEPLAAGEDGDEQPATQSADDRQAGHDDKVSERSDRTAAS